MKESFNSDRFKMQKVEDLIKSLGIYYHYEHQKLWALASKLVENREYISDLERQRDSACAEIKRLRKKIEEHYNPCSMYVESDLFSRQDMNKFFEPPTVGVECTLFDDETLECFKVTIYDCEKGCKIRFVLAHELFDEKINMNKQFLCDYISREIFSRCNQIIMTRTKSEGFKYDKVD